uniref:TBD domain-containing protein n=1 Tax=Steinernema glaseri TaxID=37863 RepID=A0A1I7Y0S6_9BILA
MFSRRGLPATVLRWNVAVCELIRTERKAAREALDRQVYDRPLLDCAPVEGTEIIAPMEKQLVSVGEASSKVHELKECLTRLTKDLGEYNSNELFLSKCEHCSAGLETERKAHAEELRLINQDINHLEDILKNLRNSQETKKIHLARKIADFQMELHRTNDFCRLTGLSGEQLLDGSVLSIFKDVTNGQFQVEPIIPPTHFLNFFPPNPFFFPPRLLVTPKDKLRQLQTKNPSELAHVSVLQEQDSGKEKKI